MSSRCLACLVATVVSLTFQVGRRLEAQAPATGAGAALQRFWAAPTPSQAAQVVADIVASGISFDEALRRLRNGRPYLPQKTGVIKLSNRTEDRIVHYYALNVPDGYDPKRRYQVRFQLHGGIGGRTGNQPVGSGEIGRLAGVEQIYVLPYGWKDAPWWSDDQVLNLQAILDALKRSYNVDENRVVVAGTSDGGTGAYYFAMRDTTPFASFLTLNGSIMALTSDDMEVIGNPSPNNLRNKPLFVVNGGRDRLYPTSVIEPIIEHMKKNGVAIDYHPQPNAGHDTTWWPELKDTFEKFVTDNRRDPLPDRLTLEATLSSPFKRAHWLIIDRLGPQPDDPRELSPDVNRYHFVGRDGSETSWRLFNYKVTSGRVDLVRTGNTIEVSTKGVAEITLLLSPDRFDFTQPVKVVANGRLAFEGRVQPNLKTLLKWAARDNDRTMLFGAEVHLDLAAPRSH